MSGRPLLITTIAARDGGVPTMLRFAIDALRRQGWDPHLAYYQPCSISPELSVPLQGLGRRSASSREEVGIDGTPATAVGAWLPELEFTHYRATRDWRRLIDAHPAHLVISGTAIAATALAQTGRRFVCWLATDLDGDRRDRVAGFPWYRRALDAALNRHVLRRNERKILRTGHVLALSRHTKRELEIRAGRSVVQDVLPSPVDTGRFIPRPGATVPGKIGFSGRLDDPRKNLPLLLDAFALLSRNRPEAELHLIGHRAGSPVEHWIRERQLGEKVKLYPYMPPGQLPEILATLDVFVVPSHQEGLCIAALEAMACGVPVISTRCGGPEDFVRDGETGYLVDSNAEALSNTLARLVADRPTRDAISDRARACIESDYSVARAQAILGRAMDLQFPIQTRSFHA